MMRRMLISIFLTACLLVPAVGCSDAGTSGAGELAIGAGGEGDPSTTAEGSEVPSSTVSDPLDGQTVTPVDEPVDEPRPGEA